MIPDFDFAHINAAVVGAITGASVTAAILFVMHQRRVKAERRQEDVDRPHCLYSTHDPLNAGIIRATRGTR